MSERYTMRKGQVVFDWKIEDSLDEDFCISIPHEAHAKKIVDALNGQTRVADLEGRVARLSGLIKQGHKIALHSTGDDVETDADAVRWIRKVEDIVFGGKPTERDAR